MERLLTVQRVEKEHSRVTIKDAEALVNMICSFETVVTAHLFHQIFTIKILASSYLQSEKIDMLTAIRLVENFEMNSLVF